MYACLTVWAAAGMLFLAFGSQQLRAGFSHEGPARLSRPVATADAADINSLRLPPARPWMQTGRMDTPNRPAGFLSRSDVMRRGGWTLRLVSELLEEPDLRAANPHWPGGAEMMLYRTERVEAAEQTAEFREAAGRARRG